MHECTTTACQMIYQILTSPTELLFGYHGGKPRMIKEKEKKSFWNQHGHPIWTYPWRKLYLPSHIAFTTLISFKGRIHLIYLYPLHLHTEIIWEAFLLPLHPGFWGLEMLADMPAAFSTTSPLGMTCFQAHKVIVIHKTAAAWHQ